MTKSNSFWEEMARFAGTHQIVIDRPKGQSHPHYPEMIYPLDYGYVEGTSASDGGGIDVWFGSLGNKKLTGILCTFDTLTCACATGAGKRDAEIKILLGCTEKDVQLINSFYGDEVKTLHIATERQ